MSLEGLEKLDLWRKARDFAVRVYREILPLLPQEEKWGLNQQIRRSAQSISANIAEGYGRYYFQDNVRFCYIARGSLEETISHLSLAHRLEYLPNALFKDLIGESDDLVRLINGYIAYLKRKKSGDGEPGSDLALREPLGFYETNGISDPSSEIPGDLGNEQNN
jgi:four helix bundle protein